MKATLEFTLPDEREEFETAVHAQDYAGALHDVREALRSKAKYECEAPETTWQAAYELVLSVLSELNLPT